MAVEGDWLVALEQDAGGAGKAARGNRSTGNFMARRWSSLRPGDPPAPSLALVAGLALIEAVEVAAPDAPLIAQMAERPDARRCQARRDPARAVGRPRRRRLRGQSRRRAAISTAARPRRSADAAIAPQAFAPLLAASFARCLPCGAAPSPAPFARPGWRARTRSARRSRSTAAPASGSPAPSTGSSPTARCGCACRRDDRHHPRRRRHAWLTLDAASG